MKNFRLIVMLITFLSLTQSARAFTTYYYPSGATATGTETVCQSVAAAALTCNVPSTGSTQLTGSASNVTVTYTWYYNTTGSVVTGTAIPSYTGLTYTAGSAAQVLVLPSAAISTTTAGVYYYYVKLTGTNTADGSGSAISITSNTQTVTVKAPPGTITGTGAVCVGSTLTLSDPVTGGTWTSGSTGIATIGGATGVVTGVAPGTAPITYSTGCGSAVTANVTVNGSPGVISGSSAVCVGSVITLADATSGGLWSSTATSVATVNAAGAVTGISAGTTTISYATTCGTPATKIITVNASILPIAGPGTVCAGSNITLTDGIGGGTWTSGSGGIAGVGSSSGIVNGVSAGTANITYTSSCGTAFATVTVNGAPLAISGTLTVCAGNATSLTDATTGGTWTSGSTSIATVDPVAGVVTGAAQGTSIITYTNTCGNTTATVTVNDVPAAIGGITSICISGITTLTDAMSGGSWTASGDGTVGSATGIVTGGASAGTANITYSTGCGTAVTIIVSVNGAPSAITGGPVEICPGINATIFDASAGGVWSVGSTLVATVDPTGVVTGVGAGTTVVSYSTGCGSSTMSVTIDASPSAISGIMSLCGGMSTTLNDAPAGGVWSSSATSVATIDPVSGVVTAVGTGVTTIDYTTACGFATAGVTVNTVPPVAITDTGSVCTGNMLSLTDATPGGSWVSGATGTATVDAAGNVTGVAMGTVTISYTTGCGTPATTVVTVNPTPSVIGGSLSLCGGITSTLTNSASIGSWSSTASGVATIDPLTGIVTTVGTGTTTISFTNMCSTATAVLTVTAMPPAAITGSVAFCSGTMLTLADAISGGSWNSDATGVATVDASGDVTGVAMGTADITYSTGCGADVTTIVTVNPTPTAIGGSLSLCGGISATLTETATIGSWSSTDAGVATIDPVTGVVTTVGTGTTTISFTNMCGTATAILTVTAMPPVAITGSGSVCAGSMITLSDAIPGGTWSSDATGVAMVDASGDVTGVAMGTADITYSTGCGTDVTTIVTVNPLPAAITVPGTVCNGSNITLSDAVSGGTWSSTGAFATIDATTGGATGVAAGVEMITYTTGCGSVTAPLTVVGAPAAISGPTTVCVGSAITLSCGTPYCTWSTSSSSVATVDVVTGVVTGVTVGGFMITASTGCGTDATYALTVIGALGAISGPSSVCMGSAITLSSTGSGTWSVGDPSLGSIDVVTGVFSGTTAGTETITCTTGCGTDAYYSVTVVASPAAIAGVTSLCVGGNTTLTDAVSGGTWSTTTPTIVSVDGPTGSVTGLIAGSANIVYSTSCGMDASYSMSINNTPDPITGSTSVCETATTTLTETTGGGTWSSSSIPNATIDPSTGIVTGVLAGSVTISYATACGTAMMGFTVNPATAVVTGTMSLCAPGSTTLADATSGGTWSSSATAIATVDPASGVVTGLSVGTSDIIYTSATCGSQSATVTVNGMPASVSGLSTVCVGANITLSDVSSVGTWTSSDATIASVDPVSGIVTGQASGVATISYTTMCGNALSPVTVNGVGAAITGTNNVCNGFGLTLSCTTTGGTWSSATPSIATVDAGGVVTGLACGTTVISYSNSCAAAVFPFTVNCTPAIISGAGSNMCTGGTITLNDAVTGGTWSNSTGNTTVDPVSGVVTGVSTGPDTIYYATGCGFPQYYPVQVIADPSAVVGIDSICVNASTVLSDAASGGTWTTSDPTIATIGSASGVATGMAAGTVNMMYSTGCGTAAVFAMTVNPIPSAITGLSSLCQFSSITLSDGGVGSWTSSNSTIATIDAVTGVISALGNGVDTIYYTLTTGGCATSKVVSVNPFPSAGIISGTTVVCVGDSVHFSDLSVGGVWTSTDPTVATVSGTGFVTGVANGSTTINYSVTNGCGTANAHKTVTVNTVPNAGSLSGASSICIGTSTSLTASVTGGNWTVSNAAVTTVSSGSVTGEGAGTDTVFYSITNVCGTGSTYLVMTVIDSPAAITGTLSVCVSSYDTLFNSSAGGTWSSSDLGTATINSGTGIITGVTAGLVTMSYSTGCGSPETVTVVVNPLASAGVISGLSSLCTGSSVTLTDTSSGGTWGSTGSGVSVSGSVVTATVPGLDTVYYSVSNMCSSSIAIWPVTVNASAVAGVLLGSDSVCVTAIISITPSQPGGTWSFSNGNASVSGGTVTGVTAGMDSLFYTVTSTFCGSQSTAMVITVLPQPNAGAISGGGNVCVGSTLFLSESAPGGVWSSSAAGVASVSSGVVNGIAAGLATISYTVTNTCGSASASQVVTVNPLVLPGAITGVDTICVAASVGFNETVSGGVWSSSNTLLATIGTTGVVTGMTGGLDTLYYTVSNICNTAVASFPLFVLAIPSPGTISGSSSLCISNNTTLSSTTTGGTWSTSSTNVMLVGDVVTGALAGSAVITYTVANVCGSASDTFGISVDAPVTPVVSGSSWVCMGYRNHLDTLAGTPAGGIWSTAISLDTISASGVLTGGTSGTVTVTYTYINGCGVNVGTADIIVYTKEECDSALVVSSVKNQNVGLVVYPNPSSGIITIEMPGVTGEVSVTIADMYGREVIRKEFVVNTINGLNFDLSQYASGGYIVRVTADGKVYTSHVIVSH